MSFLQFYVHCCVCGGGGYAGIESLTGDYSKIKHDDPEICKRILAERREHEIVEERRELETA